MGSDSWFFQLLSKDLLSLLCMALGLVWQTKQTGFVVWEPAA